RLSLTVRSESNGSPECLQVGQIESFVVNRRRNRPIGPWHLHVWEPAKWVQIKKKEITGLVTYKKVEFCPHCGDKLTVSRDWGIAIAEVTHAVYGSLAQCKG